MAAHFNMSKLSQCQAQGMEALEDGKGGTSMKDEKANFKNALGLIWNGPLLPLFIVFGMEIVGGAMTLPVFAFFVINELKLSAASMGVLGSGFNLAQAVGSPIFGRISDAIGRKSVLLACFAWSSACFYLTYFVQGFYDLFAVRLLAGLSGGSIPISTAMIMDVANVAERPQLMGIKVAAFGLCFTVGPLVAVILLGSNLLAEQRDIFLVSAGFCFVGFLLGCFVLQETLPAEQRRAFDKSGAEKRADKNGLLQDDAQEWSWVSTGMMCAWSARFFYAFGTFSMFYTYSFVIKENFGWSEKELGLIMMVAGMSEGILATFMYPHADKFFGEYVVCVVGFACMASALPLIASTSIPLHLLGFFGFQLGQCFAEPGVINLVGHLCPSDRHMGSAQGTSNSFRACASVVAPICAGILFDIKPIYTFVCASAAVFIAAALVLVAEWFDNTDPEQQALLHHACAARDSCGGTD